MSHSFAEVNQKNENGGGRQRHVSKSSKKNVKKGFEFEAVLIGCEDDDDFYEEDDSDLLDEKTIIPLER